MPRSKQQHREYMRAWRKRGCWLRDARLGIGGPRDYEWRSPLHPRFVAVVATRQTNGPRVWVSRPTE